MHKGLFLIVILLFSFGSIAQEFNATVQINAEQTDRVDLPIFETLERSLTEFINTKKWTEQEYRTEERINCSFFITIATYDNNRFESTMQVSASRPVYGSTYETTTLNINDQKFNFDYLEFQPLNYNTNSFDSNLISGIVFYLYTILGIDADTFEKNGGTDFYEEAKSIVNLAQSSNELGWDPNTSKLNRYKLNNDLLLPAYDGYREVLYTYHRQGLDLMHEDPKKAKENIAKSFDILNDIQNTRPNSAIMRVFYDAKAQEIGSIFSDGPKVSIAEVLEILQRTGPTYSKNWKDIKF